MLPPGLNYVSSWVDLQFTRCFQLMETDDVSLFSKWTDQWQDLVEFEIIPVRTSAEAMAINASAMRDPKKIGNTQRAKPCFLAFVKGKIRNMNF